MNTFVGFTDLNSNCLFFKPNLGKKRYRKHFNRWRITLGVMFIIYWKKQEQNYVRVWKLYQQHRLLKLYLSMNPNMNRVYVDTWKNRFSGRDKEPNRTLPEDIFIVSDGKPQTTVSDFKRLGWKWTLLLLLASQKTLKIRAVIFVHQPNFVSKQSRILKSKKGCGTPCSRFS